MLEWGYRYQLSHIHMGNLALSLLSFIIVGFSAAYGMAAAVGGSSTGITSEAAAGPKDSSSAKLMGVEIETSVIKIQSPDEERLGFSFTQNDATGKDVWSLEEDTLDATFSKIEGVMDFDRNLELKTHGGLKIAEINDVALDMEHVIKTLYESARSNLVSVESGMLEGILSSKYKAHPIAEKHKSFLIKSKETAPEGCIIKPQITYQLPLEELPHVFRRLDFLKHRNVPYFLRDLDPTIAFHGGDPHSLAEKLKETPLAGMFGKLAANKEKANPIRLHFKNDISKEFTSLPEGPVKGFIQLILYYWYELFNGKEPVGPEPGLKQYLAIMSRVPLSQLYDFLKEEEKAEVRTFIEPHLVFGNACRLRKYVNYDNEPIENPLTFTQWFETIIDPSKRQERGDRNTDHLSPPWGLPRSYSMGYLDVESDANGFALIEVRGYSNLEYKGSPLTITKIREFLADESAWFFSK